MGKWRTEKKQRVELARPFLKENQHDTYLMNGYLYVNRFHGGENPHWEVCEYTPESYERQQEHYAKLATERLDSELMKRLSRD
jgi:hypothetical protein